IAGLGGLRYADRAAAVLGRYLTDFSPADLRAMCEAAYARFDPAGVAPLRALSGRTWAMELWHGPTLAFKDVALTLLPGLMAAAGKALGDDRELVILAATSGDTGKAALEGFMDAPGAQCVVFYPEGGVSEAQRLQMVTQRGGNVAVIAVRGNFDDAQTGVKRLFADRDLARQLAGRRRALSAANSMNFGRLAPQVAYYFSAYADLAAAGRLRPGEKLNFCVPTGNFGNILAAVYAGRMGLPIGRLICASNRNNVLADFIGTGAYDARRPFYLTSSPSMDILISSNLERLLFELCGRDAARLNGYMQSLRDEGRYAVEPDVLCGLQSLMWGGWAGDDAVTGEIARVWQEEHYLIDPHTAVASAVLRDYRAATGDPTPCVVVSTASPFKFGRAVARALLPASEGDDFTLCRQLSELTGLPLPAAIAELPSLPIRHTARCDPNDMRRALLRALLDR
ncbi:MAG: threonine synthase, partial [Clostridiales bacterium]|nr:threonine synthase [Clostridiales bacterium]